MSLLPGTEGSNPSPSSGESSTNPDVGDLARRYGRPDGLSVVALAAVGLFRPSTVSQRPEAIASAAWRTWIMNDPRAAGPGGPFRGPRPRCRGPITRSAQIMRDRHRQFANPCLGLTKTADSHATGCKADHIKRGFSWKGKSSAPFVAAMQSPNVPHPEIKLLTTAHHASHASRVTSA